MGLKLPCAVRLFEWVVSQDARITAISVQRIAVELGDPRQLPQRCGPRRFSPVNRPIAKTMLDMSYESLSDAALPCSEPVAQARRRRDDSSKEHQRQR